MQPTSIVQPPHVDIVDVRVRIPFSYLLKRHGPSGGHLSLSANSPARVRNPRRQVDICVHRECGHARHEIETRTCVNNLNS